MKQIRFDAIHKRYVPSLPSGSLRALLSGDLDFHGCESHDVHGFHSFPAKFPPQLPATFIAGLTRPGERVLDPMAGSGTTLLEAYLSEREAIGFDIDPLALRICRVKTTPISRSDLIEAYQAIARRAKSQLRQKPQQLRQELGRFLDEKTGAFADYWFAPQTQIALFALASEINKILDPSIRSFFELAFSSVIITKSGGVSLALDLAHTRPHRAKRVFSQDGAILYGHELADTDSARSRFLTKHLRSPVDEFEKRCVQNIQWIPSPRANRIAPTIESANAQAMPLADQSIDLIVTSPPYAANAIDYMRAHKFSLIWLGYPIDALGRHRREYIGGEMMKDFQYEDLPPFSHAIVSEISELDPRKGRVLHRYYSEMSRVLRECYRVLKPGKTAIVVVGSSIMRGRETQTQNCLADIGRQLGFEVPQIGVRQLDRNKRMLPAGAKTDKSSQIQQRMHEEYVIGFRKPIIDV